jgi:hypothetical protein
MTSDIISLGLFFFTGVYKRGKMHLIFKLKVYFMQLWMYLKNAETNNIQFYKIIEYHWFPFLNS